MRYMHDGNDERANTLVRHDPLRIDLDQFLTMFCGQHAGWTVRRHGLQRQRREFAAQTIYRLHPKVACCW
jgi:hypothetical protein